MFPRFPGSDAIHITKGGKEVFADALPSQQYSLQLEQKKIKGSEPWNQIYSLESRTKKEAESQKVNSKV